MKKGTLVICVALLICLFAQSALAYTSASSVMYVYNQYGTWSGKGLSNGRTLKSSGCQIYTYAHAIQWLSGQKRTSSDGGNLLDVLIIINNDPSDKYHSGGTAQKAYHKYLTTTEEISTSRGTVKGIGIAQSVSKPGSEAEYIALFNQGGVTVSNPGEHYVLAVGYTYYDVDGDGDKELLIQIVDSSMGSTIKRRANGTIFAFGTFKPIAKSSYESYWKGGQYWITYDEFKSFRHDRAYVPVLDVIDSVPRIGVSNKSDADSDTCRLQTLPYDEDRYNISVLDKGTIVYIAGAVKNRYGNTWYKIVDAHGNHRGYIWSGDLEITESNATVTKKADVNLLGVVKTKDGYLKEKPYEAAYHGSTIAKGKTVTIVASYTNSHGNLWYKTSDGYFIYSGDVTTYQMETLFTISAVFRNTERRESHIAPYLDSADGSVYKSGAEVTVKRFVKNSHGNIWAELSDGSFLCFYDKDTGENKMQFVRMTSDFEVTGTDGYVPTGKRSVSSCPLRGKITGKVPMLTVTARVVNRSTGESKISVTANMQMGVKTIDINSTAGTSNKVNINNSMPFKQVNSDGYYRYEVAVQLGFTYNGRTFKFGGEQIAIKSDFWIGNPDGEEPPLGDVARIPGDVNDDGKVTSLDAQLTMKYAAKWAVTINLSNADVNADGKVNSVDAQLILKYAAKWDVVLR